jgi:putative SOS response-associated peptidase YedK
MCGRYSLTSPVEAVRRLFGLVPGDAMAARYNVAPSQVVPLVRRRDSGNEVAMLRWGLIPAWAKDPAIGHKMINARSETVAEKPAFRNAYRRRRCLVPADGFYEWKRLGGRKAPYRIVIGDGEPFAFAGLWEAWLSPQGDDVETFTILTTDANAVLAPVHHRMPVILPAELYDPWLDPAASPDAAWLAPRELPGLRAYRVSTYVNSPAHDDAGCLEPAHDLEPEPLPAPPASRQGELF